MAKTNAFGGTLSSYDMADLNLRSLLSRGLVVVALLSALAVPTLAGDTLYGTIVEVKAGNLAVLDYGQGKYTVKLIGINLAKDKTLAQKAKDVTTAMLLNKRVQMRFGYRDSAGQMVSRLLTVYTDTQKGEDLGEKLVSAGLAKKQADYDYPCGCLGKAEKEAQAAKRGVWAVKGAAR